MNLRSIVDKVAEYRQGGVSTKIGKSLANYYRSGKSLKPKAKSMHDILEKEREKEHESK